MIEKYRRKSKTSFFFTFSHFIILYSAELFLKNVKVRSAKKITVNRKILKTTNSEAEWRRSRA